jgi:hypothetical protein
VNSICGGLKYTYNEREIFLIMMGAEHAFGLMLILCASTEFSSTIYCNKL